MSLDVRLLLPVDAIAALRSFGRRWRSALLPLPDDDEAEERCHRLGPDGRSAVDLANDTVATLASLSRVVDDLVHSDHPVVLAALMDPTARHFDGVTVDDVGEVLDLLAAEATALADRAARLARDDWSRTGTLSGGGGTVTVLDVVREAVRTASDDLRAAERALG